MKALIKTIIIVLCNATYMMGQGRLDVVLNHSVTTEKLSSNYGISKVVYAGAKGDTLGKFGWINGNGYMNLLAPSGIEKMCMSYYENRIEPNDSSVILVINYLEIKNEKTEHATQLQCKGNFTYCVLRFGTPFVIQELDTTLLSPSNPELKQIEGGIRNLLDLIVLAIEPGIYKKLIRKYEGSIGSLKTEIPRFITDSVKVMGFYRSCAEIASNSPSVTNAYRHEMKGGKHLFYVTYANTKFPKNDYYGYSDGEKVYINTSSYRIGKEMIEISGAGPIIWWHDKIEDPDLMMGMGVAFGLIGALGTAFVTTTSGFFLDLRNCRFYTMTIQDLELFLSDSPDLFEEYKLSKNKKSFSEIENFLKRYNEKWNREHIEEAKK